MVTVPALLRLSAGCWAPLLPFVVAWALLADVSGVLATASGPSSSPGALCSSVLVASLPLRGGLGYAVPGDRRAVGMDAVLRGE